MEEVDKNDYEKILSTINIEKIENFKLIWLDKTFSYSDKDISAKLQFQHITPYLKTFFNVTECFDYILNSDADYNILIISLDTFEEIDIVAKASSLIQLTFLYVISSSCQSKNDVYSKHCRAVFTNIKGLLIKLSEDIQCCTQSTVKFNIFTSATETGQSSKDLTKQSAKFIWFQCMLGILLDMAKPDEAKNDMIEFCRLYYVDNQIEQNKITDFELHYRSEEAIKWYTRDSFLFRIVNKVLRAESIDYMYKLRYIFTDIYIQLLELHCDYLQLLIDLEFFPYARTVYRGQLMSNRELDQLRRNVGCYISMNTFLSTSTNREVSLLFSGDGAQRPQLESILFEIIIHTDVCSSPFADITNHSWNKDEEEILLVLGAIFRIDSVELNDNTWMIKLTLCNQDSTDIKSVHDFLPKIEQNVKDYASCLYRMGEAKRAADICANEIQLRVPTRDWDTFRLFNDFAVFSMRSGDTDLRGMLKCYQLCVKLIPRQFLSIFANILINAVTLLSESGLVTSARKLMHQIMIMIASEIDATLSDQVRRLKMELFASSYITLGVIYGNQDEDKEAFDYLQAGLRIFKGHLSSSDEQFGWVYSIIANIYFKQGKYNAAIEFGQKALTIYLQCSLSSHPNIVNCYHDLGMSYLYSGEVSKACKTMDITLEYRLNADSINKTSVGLAYFNIGNLFSKTDHDAQALAYYFKVKEMWHQHLPEGSFRFGHLFLAIGRVYGEATGNFIMARDFLEKALEIESNHLKTNSRIESISLGQIYMEFGRNYYKCGKFNEALIYYEKSSIILARHLPPTHIDLFHLCSYIAVTHQDMHNHILALEYYKQALDTLFHEESASLDKEHIGNTYGNIGSVYLQNKSYREAISYFEKEIDTKSAIMTLQSPAFITTYINLGNAHSSLNNFTEAVDYLHRALHIAKIVFPKYHGNLASIYNNLAGVCAEQGKNNDALEYAKLSLEVKQNCMPSDHPSIATAYNTLGCIYGTLYDYDEAVRNYEAALTIFQKHHSDKSVTLAAVNANLGTSYYRLDQWDRAADYLEQSLTILRSIYDDNNDNHIQFAFSYDTLALVKCAQGFREVAECYCQKAFDLRSIDLPPDHVDIALSFETFGVIHNAQMNYETALIYFHKSETILHHINDEYPKLVRIFRETGSVFYNQTKYSQALEYYTKAFELAIKVYPTNPKLLDRLKYGLDRVMDLFLSR